MRGGRCGTCVVEGGERDVVFDVRGSRVHRKVDSHENRCVAA